MSLPWLAALLLFLATLLFAYLWWQARERVKYLEYLITSYDKSLLRLLKEGENIKR